jgi:hypothetical protein
MYVFIIIFNINQLQKQDLEILKYLWILKESLAFEHEMDCDQTAMRLLPATSAVFPI